MTTEYERLKSYSITATYLENPVPSTLVSSYDLLVTYDPTAGGGQQVINGLGFDSFSYGQAKTQYRQYLKPKGFNVNVFGTSSLKNKNQEVKASGFSANTFGIANVYNSRQYLKSLGLNANVFGPAYLIGGVKYLNPYGVNSLAIGNAKVINTKATQYAYLSGISAPSITAPLVSPRFLRPSGFNNGEFGTARIYLKKQYIQAKGQDVSKFGTQWVSYNPRHLNTPGFESFDTGYPKIRDRAQRVYIYTVIAGGIFGDVAIRNNRRYLNASGFNAQQFSNWSNIENTRRLVDAKPFDSLSFGQAQIWNKSPSIAPGGIDSFNGLSVSIGYRIRSVKTTGKDSLALGTPSLSKTPELLIKGFNANAFGTAWISNWNQYLEAKGKNTSSFGAAYIGFRYRNVQTQGPESTIFTTPRIEFSRRTLFAKGTDHALLGNSAWISFLKRTLQPQSISEPAVGNQQIGGTQNIKVNGFSATQFGTRIIPESQTITPLGFSNAFGESKIQLKNRYIHGKGFFAAGLDDSQRWGNAKIWNTRQYIVQYFIHDSGLVPPIWQGWTSIANRNRRVKAYGFNASKIAEPLIQNNARVLSVKGFDSFSTNKSMIADRIRKIKLSGIEAPYMGGWNIIYNDAQVLGAKGFNSNQFGQSSILNTRRYYNRIGNFESQAFGTAFIAYRVRNLNIESRHSIAPPSIKLPTVQLHTRYLDEVGRIDAMAFGHPELSIHWNIIAPKWIVKNEFGYPALRKVTPELLLRGHDSFESGNTSIRTQWRDMQAKGDTQTLWGGPSIGFRDRQFSMSGFHSMKFGDKAKVTKTAAPPYSLQNIWLDAVEIDGNQNFGHGIAPIKDQVSAPGINQNVLYPAGISAASFGTAFIYSNNLQVNPGIQNLVFGTTHVSLKNRTISAKSIDNTIKVGKPGLSPHTIYAVMEAPAQAIENHTRQSLHYVNSDYGHREPGEVFGHATISLRHRKINNVGLGSQLNITSDHSLKLRKRYINLTNYGFNSLRSGWHIIGPFDQVMEQYDSSNHQIFGYPSIQHVDHGPKKIKPAGIFDEIISAPRIELFNCSIAPRSFDSLIMGSKLNNDQPYMWQGLRIGEFVPGNYGGFNAEKFGQTVISLKVRNIEIVGFESFDMQYDYTKFNERMCVIKKELPRPQQLIKALGFAGTGYGVPNIANKVHYIRPDGNAEQYRKGAF